MNWYTESNIRQGLLESALVTSQIALELLFNLICVESKAIISKAEAKKSIAARKIDLLAETISFSEDSLYEFTHLIKFFEDNKLKYRFFGPRIFIPSLMEW